MEIKYRTVYTVTPFNQPPIKFDRVEDAVACVDRALHNAFDHINQNAFDGSVSWATEEAPATPLDDLVLNLSVELHEGCDLSAVDRSDPYLMVQENRVSGGFYLMSGKSPDALYKQFLADEDDDRWEVADIFDTATGEQVHGTFTETKTYEY